MSGISDRVGVICIDVVECLLGAGVDPACNLLLAATNTRDFFECCVLGDGDEEGVD